MKRFKKILTILPEGRPTEDVLAWSKSIASAADSTQVTIIKCFEPLLAEYPEIEGHAPDLDQEQAALSAELSGQFAEGALDLKVAAAELLPTVLHELSDGSYDLVLLPLVGVEHRSLVERLSRKSPVGILGIPKGCSVPPESILVGIDYSDLSKLALEWAEAFASLKGEDCRLEALHTYRVPFDSRATGAVNPEQLRNHLDRLTKKQISDFIEEHDKTKKRWTPTAIESTYPGQFLAEKANAENTGLIIIGSHGRSPFKIALLGSHAADVLRHAKRPVLVVKQKNQSLPFLRSLLGLSQ